MKFRGILTTLAAALVCCCTLGCPPAEEGADTGASDAGSDVTAPADDNTTE